MPGIVCAIRGGPLSQPTIQQAIEQAKDTQLPIYFLYVVNLDFLSYTEQSRTQTIQQEMRAMGEFICLKAQIEARRAGTEANVVVREGNVTEEIINLCREVQADFVVMGRPNLQKAENVFDQQRLENFRKMVEREAGVQVIYPSGEVE